MTEVLCSEFSIRFQIAFGCFPVSGSVEIARNVSSIRFAESLEGELIWTGVDRAKLSIFRMLNCRLTNKRDAYFDFCSQILLSRKQYGIVN